MPAALCTDLAKPPPAAAPGSELWLGSERAAASLITHGSLCRALAGSLTLPRRPVRPRPRQSRPDLIPPLCPFASLPPCGNTPSGALRPAPSLTLPLRPHFPLLWPKPGLSLHLAKGLEKPRSATAGSGRQRPISCAKRPGRNSFLFRSSHPVCFSWAPPGQAPFKPRAMGARRDARTPWDAHTAALTRSQTHLQKQWSFHRLGGPCRHPRAHTVHRHTYTRHTSLCLVTESGPRQEARCPRSGSPPPTALL